MFECRIDQTHHIISFPIGSPGYLVCQFHSDKGRPVRINLCLSLSPIGQLKDERALLAILRCTSPYPIMLIHGTSFQKKVWKAVQGIPFGKTLAYGEIAKILGLRCPRAIGQALKKNAHPLLIPCHRVIKENGDIGGYSQGINVKKALLEFEHAYSRHE